MALVRDLRGLFQAEPETSREALKVLLDGKRLRVSPHPDRAFEVTGLLRLPLEMRTAQGDGLWAVREDGSGGPLRHGRTMPESPVAAAPRRVMALVA